MVPYFSKQQIWVFGDLRNQRLMGFSCNVLAKARNLATELDLDLVFILFEGQSSPCDSDPFGGESLSVDRAVETAAGHGADLTFCFENPCFSPPQAHITAAALAEAIRQYQPYLCLFALTDFGRELAARTAAIGNLGLAADCAEITVEKGRVVGLCPSLGGSIMAKIVFADHRTTGLATVQPFGKLEIPAKEYPATLQRRPLSIDFNSDGLRLVSRRIEPASNRQLEEAEKVIVGGMGLSCPKGFELLNTFAAVLGGQVAATRPPVLNGWVAEERMLGQTGKRVKPKLLISVGTSGAVQYTAGIIESGVIVAINRDPSAPIFQIADIGIVADASGFLPLLIDRAKQAMMRSLVNRRNGNCKEMQLTPLGTFGEKVRNLRQAQQWDCEDLAEATGQTREFIEKVEADILMPPVGFLLRLSEVLKVAPDTFLDRRSKTTMLKERRAAHVRRTHNYAYKSLTNDAEYDHLRAFVLTIKPNERHKPVAYKHEGEEFIWVQSGVLELTLGSESHVLETGESKHFNSNTPHRLKSLSDHPTQCLVVLYTM